MHLELCVASFNIHTQNNVSSQCINPSSSLSQLFGLQLSHTHTHFHPPLSPAKIVSSIQMPQISNNTQVLQCLVGLTYSPLLGLGKQKHAAELRSTTEIWYRARLTGKTLTTAAQQDEKLCVLSDQGFLEELPTS